MAERTVQLREQTCDICERKFLRYPSEEEPLGFYLRSVYRIHESGASAVEGIYICPHCFRTPIRRIFDKGIERDDAELRGESDPHPSE